MVQPEMNPQDAAESREPDWRVLEHEVLARAKKIAQKIVDRVKQVTRDTTAHAALPDTTDETPPVSEPPRDP